MHGRRSQVQCLRVPPRGWGTGPFARKWQRVQPGARCHGTSPWCRLLGPSQPGLRSKCFTSSLAWHLRGAPRARQTPPGPAPSVPLTRPGDFIGHAPSLKFPDHAHVVYISTFVADAPTTTAGCSGIVQKGDWKSLLVRLPYDHLKAFLPPRRHPSGV